MMLLGLGAVGAHIDWPLGTPPSGDSWDLAGATLTVAVSPPQSTTRTWTATATTVEGAQVARYTTQADDIDVRGVWHMRLTITLADGRIYPDTEVVSVRVV